MISEYRAQVNQEGKRVLAGEARVIPPPPPKMTD
jgi:hypothetical protein